MRLAVSHRLIVKLSDEVRCQMNGIGVDSLDFQFIEDIYTEHYGCQFKGCLKLIGAYPVAVDVADCRIQLDLDEGVERLSFWEDIAKDAMDRFNRSFLIGCQWIAVEEACTTDTSDVFLYVFWMAKLRPTISQNDGEEACEIIRAEHLFEMGETSDNAACSPADN